MTDTKNTWKTAEGKLTKTAKVVIGVGAVAALIIVSSISTGIAGGTSADTVKDAVSATSAPTPTKTTAPVEAPKAPAVPEGSTLATAAAAGSIIDASDALGDKYSIQFGAVNWDATAAITGENMFNKAPDAGQKYIMVPVTITNTGASEMSPGVAMLDAAFISADGMSHKSMTFIVIPNDTLSGATLYAGTSLAGNVAFTVPVATTDGAFVIGGAFVKAN